MFMGEERLAGMGSFLCAELLDFAAAERRHGGAVGIVFCEPGECQGLGHLPQLARAAAPEPEAAAELLRRFGAALFVTLLRRYPSFFVGIASTSELLAAFERQLAAEINKLAPHVVLPAVTVEPCGAGSTRFTCRFPGGRDDVAPLVAGLVLGSARHFGERFEVEWRQGAEPGLASFVVAPRARAAAAPGG